MSYKITEIANEEIAFPHRGKWRDATEDVAQNVKKLAKGKSLKVEFDNIADARSFGASLRGETTNKLKGYVVGVSAIEKCVYVGKK